jgi:tetratricopeptide (TPR) repeat protein
MHNRAVTMLTAASASGSASESLARSGAGSYAAERLTPSELSAIVQAAPLETLPASTLFLLVQAAAAANHKADDGLVDRIRKIQRLHASDFWINFAAARFFESQQPPHDEDAVRYYSVAVAVRPAAAAAHSNLGAALSRLGRNTEAIAAFRLAIEAEPGFYVPYFNLGMLLCEQQEYAEAVDALRQAADASSGIAMVHERLGAALQAHGQLDDAIAEYRQALAIEPANVSTRRALEICLAAIPSSQ